MSFRLCLIIAVVIAATGCSRKLPLEVEAPTLFGVPFCFEITNAGSKPMTIEGVIMNDTHHLTKVVYHHPPIETVVGVELQEGDSVTVDNNHLSENLESIEILTNLGKRKFRF